MASSYAREEQGHSTFQETTPLLAASGPGLTAQANEESLVHDASANEVSFVHDASANKVNDKPLPKGQIFLLCYARLVEPVAFFSIFPFISQMIWETGHLKEVDVGFYSGLIVGLHALSSRWDSFLTGLLQESLFSLTQMLVMISWGRAADRFGRKPVLVISLVGVAMATSIFGLGKAIWQMILFRCLAGVFAGTVV